MNFALFENIRGKIYSYGSICQMGQRKFHIQVEKIEAIDILPVVCLATGNSSDDCNVSASIENEVQDKIRRLRAPRDKSVRSVLVYEGDLAPEVVENGYFDYIVPVELLLGR